MELNQMFTEFNKVYGIAPIERTPEELGKAHTLIQDEVDELHDELLDKEHSVLRQQSGLDQENITKELTDILYITMQRMVSMGMNVEDCLAEVHRSNMSKSVMGENVAIEVLTAQQRYEQVIVQDMGNNRFVLRCGKTGKVIKPTSYAAADMAGF